MPSKIYKVDLRSFKNWLMFFDPDEVVGRATDPSACPVKNYLTTIDSAVKKVYSNAVELSDGRGYGQALIIEKLIIAIDDYYEDREGMSSLMTAKEVLAIFKRLHPTLAKEKNVDSNYCC